MGAVWRWRERFVGGLTGDILEIGVGEGANLPYYASAQHIWAIEPDPGRAARARTVAEQLPLPITIDIAPAEALPYADHSFDVVVSSLVFCSVADQRQVLREIHRVLRPSGVLQMVEHIRPTTRWLAALFQALTPWWRQIAHNCHLDRPTLQVLAEEGWQVQVHRRCAMVIRLTAFPPV